MPTDLLRADDHQLVRHGLRLLVEQARNGRHGRGL